MQFCSRREYYLLNIKQRQYKRQRARFVISRGIRPRPARRRQASVRRGHAERADGSCTRVRSSPHPPPRTRHARTPPTRPHDNMDITRNSILRINDKKTLQLVQEIKKDDCLWNTTLDDYPNRAKRAKAAERIARALNVPNFEARHVLMKLKNLRNSYCQELKKIGHSIERTGSEDSPDNYRPKVQWFAIMDSFMRPHLQSKNVMLVNQVSCKLPSDLF